LGSTQREKDRPERNGIEMNGRQKDQREMGSGQEEESQKETIKESQREMIKKSKRKEMIKILFQRE
jgi:hypothetical protein